MDISDSESEDGQISKMEQEDERLLNLGMGFDSPNKRGRGGKEEAETPCTMKDLETCRLTRDAIAKHCIKPWFQDYVTGRPVFRETRAGLKCGCRCMGEVSYWAGAQWTACVSDMPGQQWVLWFLLLMLGFTECFCLL